MKNNTIILEKISNFSLDNPEAAFSFSARLAKENGWSLEYSNRVIDEYKKFIYMSLITGKSLTPSDEVDQAWHLHLIYSSSYWVDFCQNTLDGFKLHHGPTKGGKMEAKKYNEQYQYTLDVYNELFGTTPPTDIWPSIEVRFSPMEFRRIDLVKNYVLSKKKVKEYVLTYLAPIIGFGAMMIFMSNTTTKPDSDWTWLYWVLGIVFVIFIIRGIYRYLNRDERKSGSSSSSSYDSGCTVAGSFFGCGSGCGSSGCSSHSSGCSSSSSGCSSSSSGGDSGGSSCGGGCGGGGD